MKVALDKKTNRIISAYDVVRLGAWGTRGFNRFICPRCGRIVTFINSGGLTTNRDPYFRHEHGSFAKDCADYAASLFANYSSIERTNSKINLKFDLWISVSIPNNSPVFKLNCIVSNDELERLNKCNCLLQYQVKNHGLNAGASHNCPVNKSSFAPNEIWSQSLDTVGDELYYKLDNATGHLSFLNHFSFYKLDDEPHELHGITNAMLLQEGSSVFTNDVYIMIGKIYDLREIPLSHMSILNKLTFNDYFIYLVKLESNSKELCDFFARIDLCLCEERESLTILWPPAIPSFNGYNVIWSNVFVKTNYELDDKNTSDSFDDCNNNLYFINVCDQFGVSVNGNILKIRLNCRDQEEVDELLSQSQFIGNRQFIIPTNNFVLAETNRPYRHCLPGEEIWLYNDSFLYEYRSNYLISKTSIISQRTLKPIDSTNMIQEILQHNKCLVKFEESDLLYDGNDEEIIDYINYCKRRKLINPAVRAFLFGEN